MLNFILSDAKKQFDNIINQLLQNKFYLVNFTSITRTLARNKIKANISEKACQNAIENKSDIFLFLSNTWALMYILFDFVQQNLNGFLYLLQSCYFSIQKIIFNT